MKDKLQDLIQYVHGLGVVDLVRIDGTDTETKITAIGADKSVVVYGSFKEPVAEFEGTFGMPNLSKLQTILSFTDYYGSDAKVNVTRVAREHEQVPTAIHFESKNGDFVNDYRFMGKAVVEDTVKEVKFKGAEWNITFTPSLDGITKLKRQAQINNDEPYFNVRTDKGDLKIHFGDPSGHSGNFVFQPNINGKLERNWNFPAKVFLSIMNFPGDKIIKLSDAGVAEITIDSGITNYRFLLPAMVK